MEGQSASLEVTGGQSVNMSTSPVQVSPRKKLPRGAPPKYSSCLLYDTEKAREKLLGLNIAKCNPSFEGEGIQLMEQPELEKDAESSQKKEYLVSEKMSCNFCQTEFKSRSEQKHHYRSDWHRFNLKQRLKGLTTVTEENFEDMSGNISSLSGSDSESDVSDTETDGTSRSKPISIPVRMRQSLHSSSDSESESYRESVATRKYPKVYFKAFDGQLISLYRCVIYHKKAVPVMQTELAYKVSHLPDHMTWAVFMAGGGHFAGAVFDKSAVLQHKTFHRYIVRAKRGTAQENRDSMGNAPRSGGASIRRYNEAALMQDIQDLIASWSDLIKKCDLIFLRAPSFNRKLFFSGKNPPFKKDDLRIRFIPFPTRRATFNEVRRVHEMLASIECYGEEVDIQDFVPLSPRRQFSADSGHLQVASDSDPQSLSPRRKASKGKLGLSPLAKSKSSTSEDKDRDDALSAGKQLNLPMPDHLHDDQRASSSSAASSDVDLFEVQEQISMLDLKLFEATRKPRLRKKKKKKKGDTLKHQLEPESSVFEEEKYHLKNALYTACKTGDLDSLMNLLAVFKNPTSSQSQTVSLQSDLTNQNLETGSTSSNQAVDHKADEGLANENLAFTVFQSNHDQDGNFESLNLANENFAEATVEDTLKLGADGNFSTNDNRQNDASMQLSDMTEVLSNPQGSSNILSNQKTDAGNFVEISASVPTPERHIDEPVQNSGVKVPEMSLYPLLMRKFSDKSSLGVEAELPSPVVTEALLDEPIGDGQMTLLHVAAREGHKTIICSLLEAGADPSIKDRQGQTPYTIVRTKETRNEFRRFMARFPDKYDYEKAQIPGPLTEDMETERKQREAERKKIQRKAKQERLKEWKEEESRQREEERERRRYLNLSDREKRALAAERRLLQQATSSGRTAVFLRCFQCGADITGKVPFEYSDYKFCSPKCLKEHRFQNADKKS